MRSGLMLMPGLRSKRAASFLVRAVVLSTCAAACAPPLSPTVVAHSLVLPLTGACPSTPGTATAELTSEVSRFKVVVVGPDMSRLEAEGDGSAITIDDIPVGEQRTVGLFGFGAGPTAAWRGLTRNVSVAADKPTQVDVLMSRVADLSCARNTHVDKREFHTATVLQDGRVLIVGGARDDADASQTCGSGCARLSASGTAEIYDPRVGTFTPVGSLGVPRMMHTATVLQDGRVVVAGGAGEALITPVDGANPFPIRVTRPVTLVEVFDPATNAFSGAQDDPGGPRVFAAAVTTATGNLLITGGIPTAASVNNLSNALSSTTLCSGNPLRCISGPEMKKARAGHAAFRLDSGDVVMWGGSVDLTPVDDVPGFQLETLRSGAQGFAMLDIAAMNNDRNLFFAAISQYVSFRVLAAGGLVRNADGSFKLSTVKVRNPDAPDGPSTELLRAPVLVFDASALGNKGGIAVGDPNREPMGLADTRFLGAAASLPGGKRVLIVGGFSDLQFTPSAGLALFDESQLATVPLTVGGVPRTLRQARGGLAATGIGDGTVLLSGGGTVVDDVRVPLETSEIFADPQDPQDVR
jgi:hypothetical protein